MPEKKSKILWFVSIAALTTSITACNATKNPGTHVGGTTQVTVEDPIDEPPDEEGPADNDGSDNGERSLDLSASVDCPSEVIAGLTLDCRVLLTGVDRWTIGWAGADAIGPAADIWGKHLEVDENGTQAEVDEVVSIPVPTLSEPGSAVIVLRAWGPLGASDIARDGVAYADDLTTVEVVTS